MRFKKHSVTVLALSVAALLVTLSCGTTSRYRSKEFGKAHDGSMDVALANMDRAMGDMDAAKQRAMTRQAEGLKRGKELFNDANMGSKGLACNSCHPGGGTTGGEAEVKGGMGHGPYHLPIPSLMGAGARFPRYMSNSDEVITLAQMDNNCIRMFMGGKRLPLNTPESLYLAAYVMSFSNGEEMEIEGGPSASQ